MEENSILLTIKNLLGLEKDYDAFDIDVATHVNTAFMTLRQVGVPIPESVYVTDLLSEWSDLGLAPHVLGPVKTYVYLKTRLIFDPPSNSFVVDSMTKQIQELEWRFGVEHDHANMQPTLPIEEVIEDARDVV